MHPYPITPAQARSIANDASEAIRALNHATLPADGYPGLEYPADVHDLLGAMNGLASRMPQLLGQVSTYLKRELQHGAISVDDGPFAGDPDAAVRQVSDELDHRATRAARNLAAAIGVAHEAIAFASYVGPEPAAPTLDIWQ